MADFGSPVAQNVNPNAGLQTLQSILGIKQAQQNLQTGAIEQQNAAATAQQNTQTANQRANLATFFSHFDPTKHVGSDGTLDLDSVLTDPKLQQAAGDQFPALMEQMVKIKSGQLTAKDQLAKLNGTIRDQFGDTVGSLRTDPDVLADNPQGREKVKQAMANFAESGGPDAARVANIYSGVAQNTPPGKLAQTLSNFQLQAMDASTQAARQSPTFADTGAALQNVNPQAAGGNLGAQGPIAKSIPPGFEVVVDPRTSNPYLLNRQTGETRDMGYGYPGGHGGANAPPASLPKPQDIGGVDAIRAQTEANFRNVDANRNAARIAPQQLDQIDKALTLSQNTNTGGDWTDKRAQIESNLSSLIPGFKSAQDDAAKVQELDKFLNRITRDSNHVLGGNAATDAEREQISKTNASTGYTPQAIQKVLTYAKAQTLAMQAKGDAQENWLKQQGNGITNQQNFETAWRQAYDPVLFQLQAAKPEDRKAIIANLPPEEAGRLAKQKQLLQQLGVQ